MKRMNEQSQPKRKPSPSKPKPLRERREKGVPKRAPDTYPRQSPPKPKPKPDR